MKKIFVFGFILFTISCASFRPASYFDIGPREIILEGTAISEEEVGELESWYCKDLYDDALHKRSPILVEVGFFDNPELDNVGFILYDGGNSGDYTHYQRQGLN